MIYTPMSISPKQQRHLKKLAHKLKPVVIIGSAGLTENVINEIDLSLAHHELLKIRINVGDKAARESVINEIAQQTQADFVMHIGHIATFYRPSEKPVIQLPNI